MGKNVVCMRERESARYKERDTNRGKGRESERDNTRKGGREGEREREEERERERELERERKREGVCERSPAKNVAPFTNPPLFRANSPTADVTNISITQIFSKVSLTLIAHDKSSGGLTLAHELACRRYAARLHYVDIFKRRLDRHGIY